MKKHQTFSEHFSKDLTSQTKLDTVHRSSVVFYFFNFLTRDCNLSNFSRCGLWSLVEGRMYLFCKMGPRNWSLVGNKRWLLLGGSKCTIFVVVAIGGA